MLSRIRSRVFGNTPSIKPLPSGIYHYQLPPGDVRNYRFHLRIDSDGAGYLILNAATILHLNQTATEYAYLFVNQKDPEAAGRQIASRYSGIRFQEAKEEYERFVSRIYDLLEHSDQDPTVLLGIDQEALHSGNLSAPYRLDCALTYESGSAGTPDTPRQQTQPELGLDDWKVILDKAWEAGIPHILFTGGEPTLRTDLAKLIQHAESNGQVTGLLTNGYKLRDSAYLKELLQSGLDHTLITLTPENNASWEAIASFQYWRDLLEEDIFVGLHITVTEANKNLSSQIISQVADAGIRAVSLTAESPTLSQALERYQEESGARGIELIWGFPVPFSQFNPVTIELESGLGVESASPPGRGSLFVEPNGNVLLTREASMSAGNLLSDPWGDIWGKVTTPHA